MNKKGFTITELLAVIVILGVLTSLASVGVTRYRHSVREKELINLHSTIETGFDDYRSKRILSGDSVPNELDLCQNGNLSFDITYNGKRLNCGTGNSDVNIKHAVVSTKIKGDLLSDSKYRDVRTTEENYIEDGTCIVESKREPIKEGDTITGYELVKKCKGEASYEASKEEITCIYLETESEVLIDDYNDDNSMCRYWGN